ncbi:hypothetical protein P3T76_012458 [Phytophthora citrophthora]|uniref:BZIP domain-containing protein n=1 Tax=Phytophthora citrophthora TaxID=4793 RepID=A0AAD9LCU5_9STRA|nr:hypothetical protein P3T76_012458 [Phytophthora citrophthora]
MASIAVEGMDFDMNLLSDFLFQADELPKVDDERPTATDSTGSSDDAGASPDSPVFTGSEKISARKAKRRAQVAVSARRHRSRKKHELLDLRKEVKDLTDQLHSLRSQHELLRPDGAVAVVQEYTMTQRHKRRQAEKVNEQLRRALVMQRRFFASMQSLVLNSSVTNAELNMATLLHTYTHLGRAGYARQRDYLAMCTDSKADLALQILLRETEGINFAGSPTIVSRSVPVLTEQQQIVTTIAAYSLDCLDLKTVFVSACSAILGGGTDWPQYTTVSKDGEVLDKPQGHISYAKSSASYQSRVDAQVHKVSVESRSLVYYRMTDSYGVLVWDFADEDDLHPVEPETKIKRDLIGAAMVRREVCCDGVERVVYRSICTKLHSFSSPLAPEVGDYLQKSEEGAKTCGGTVFNYIREQAVQPCMVRV